jgi:hypothetical protein
MSQKFEIILKTVYSDRIGRRIAETNIRSVWRHILKFYSDKNKAKTLHFPSKTVSLVPRAIFVNCCTFYVQAYYTHWSTGGDNELQYDKTVYSDRIGRRIAETNIRSVWRHILKFHSGLTFSL